MVGLVLGEAGVRFEFLIIASASLSPSVDWLLLSEAHSLSRSKGLIPLGFSHSCSGKGRGALGKTPGAHRMPGVCFLVIWPLCFFSSQDVLAKEF